MRFVFLYGAQDGDRPLGGGPTVEVYERPAIHRPVENREVPADTLNIEYRTGYNL
jgi:hypothetical protein